MNYCCPTIHLLRTNKARLLLPIEAICGVEECPKDKCTRVNTLDGFFYDVKNPIEEIEKKINEAVRMVNHSEPTESFQMPEVHLPEHAVKPQGNKKFKAFKRKKMLSARIDKPERRLAEINRGETNPKSVEVTHEQEKPEPTLEPTFIDNP